MMLKSLGLAALLALGAARTAHAWSPPRCAPPGVVPAAQTVVPANLPALYYVTGRDYSQQVVTQPDGFELRASDGTLLEVTFTADGPGGSFFVKPTQPLQPGQTYRVRYPQVCDPATGGASTTILEHTFTTGPVVPRPTTLGAVAVAGRRLGMVTVPTTSGSCTTQITAALAHVVFTPSPELRAYRALASIAASINGQWLTLSNYHDPGEGGPIEFDVHADCVVPDPGAYRGIGPGQYELKMAAGILGEVIAAPPVTAQVDLRCDDGADAGASDAADGGAPPDAAPAPDAPAVDAAPTKDTAAGAPEAGSKRAASSGCSVAGGTPGLPVVAFGAWLLAGFRRRRPAASARAGGTGAASSRRRP